MASPVVFKVGTRAQYNALTEKNENALYFLTDTGEIYRGAQGLAQNSYHEDVKTIENTDEEVIANYYKNNASQYEIKGDIFVVKSLISEGVYSHAAFMYDGANWQSISSTVLADEVSVELNNGLLAIKDFGKRFYKFVAETGSEAEGNFVPAHYDLVEVSVENPWEAGLEPKVVLEDNALVIGWFQPNPTTAEGVQDQVTAVQGTVADVQKSVTEVKEDLVTTQEEVKALDEEVNSINDALYGVEGENPTVGLIQEVEELATDLDTNYYTKEETYSKTEIDGKVAGVFHFKGTVETDADLPTEGNAAGDVYQVGELEYAWNGTEWVELGFVVDLSNHATIGYVDEKVKTVNDALNAEGGIIDRVEALELVGAEKNIINSISINGTALEVSEARDIALPIFNGGNTGLVPVVPEDLEDRANHFLNANGEWSVVSIGDLGESQTVVQYIDAVLASQLGDLGEHATVTDYVDAAVAEATPAWGDI